MADELAATYSSDAAVGGTKKLGKSGTTKKLGKELSFPPLATKFNPSGTVGTWPGAEFTRRTKLKTRCVEEYSSQFLDEMRATLGERGFDAYQTALQPSISRRLSRGKPPEEGARGAIPIQARARLVRAGGELSQTMSSSTIQVNGLPSRARCLELTKTRWLLCANGVLLCLVAFISAAPRPAPGLV